MPCSGQATTPAEIADPQAPGRLQLVEHAAAAARPSARRRRCVWFGREHAERVLLEAEGLVDEADAVAQRRADDRQHRLLAAAAVAVARPGPVDVEDGEAEGVAVAAVGLDQLVEAAAHVAGLVEAGVSLLGR